MIIYIKTSLNIGHLLYSNQSPYISSAAFFRENYIFSAEMADMTALGIRNLKIVIQITVYILP